MYPLTEINGKLDKFKEDIDWLIDNIQQTWESVTWLVNFARKVEPEIERLETYWSLVPGFQAIVADLKLENQQLRQRRRNTAVLYGPILEIRAGANPPIIQVGHEGGQFDLYIPRSLFEQAGLEVGMVIVSEAALKTHHTRRGRIVVFFANSLEILNRGTVDKNFEDRYSQ